MKKLSFLFSLLVFVAACNSSKKATTTDQTARAESRASQTNDGRKKPPSADEAIKRMDANQDGRLEKSEVKGRMLENFSKIDTDGDGFLTKTELENAPRPKKGRKGQRQQRN